MSENYEGLDWDISDMPIGSSTPDELFELSYRASTECPDCGSPIEGTAQYWSRDGSYGAASWLERIDYSPCPCEEDDTDDYEYEDDEPDDLKNIF